MLAESVGSTGDGGGGAEDHILIRNEQPSGTNGGGSTAGSWITVVLNTEVRDTGGHASLAGNQITLAAGTYRIEALHAMYRSGDHKIKVRNITDNEDTVIGLNSYADSGNNGYTTSHIDDSFTITASKDIELQYRCDTSQAVNGLGRLAGYGVLEIYGSVQLTRES